MPDGPIHICSFVDAAQQTITVQGKPVQFDFSELFGPLVVDTEGQPTDKQPGGERDPFWAPFNAWLIEWRKKHPKPAPAAPRPSPSDYLDRR